MSLLLKWNVKFNTKKSKVLVIGDRLNTENGWELEKDRIDEAKEHKYLGSNINKLLKSSFHVSKYY